MTEAYVTLATNDQYALGALVLAHSLRSVNTTRQICILISPGVSEAVRSQLSNVFNDVISVDVMDSNDSAHLALLKRPELGVTFTKLHCWTLTQYTKCVFLDADVLAIQNADELFEQPELSAVPDIGWPDCFNSGVFVFSPSLETYNSLLELSETTGSFDGGDQGLLNTYFTNWNRLSFLYNMVASVTYTYLPAYKQFGKNVKFVHFLGAAKPWEQSYHSQSGTVVSKQGQEHISSHLNTWWKTFDTNVRPGLPDSVSSYLVADHSIVPEDKDAHGNEQHINYFTYHTNEYHHTDQQVMNHWVGSTYHWQPPEPVFTWPPSHLDNYEDDQTENTYNAASPFIPYSPPPVELKQADPEPSSVVGVAEGGHDATQDFGQCHVNDSRDNYAPVSNPVIEETISHGDEIDSPTPVHSNIPTQTLVPTPAPASTPLPTSISTPLPTLPPTPLPTPVPSLPTTPIPTPITTPTLIPTLISSTITPVSTPPPHQSPTQPSEPVQAPTEPKIFQQLRSFAPTTKLVPELRQKAREGENPERRPALKKRGRVPLPAPFHRPFQPFISPRHPSPYSRLETARAVSSKGPPKEVTEQLTELKISPEKDMEECQQRWEQGRPDYTGRDSFDNILAHIDSTINNN